MTGADARWTPFLTRMAGSALKALSRSDEELAGHAATLMEIAAEAGDERAREAYRRLMACVTIAMIQFWRAFPDEAVDKPGLGKLEAEALRRTSGGRSLVALMLETIDYAQQRTEAIAEAPRPKRHGRR